MTLLATAAGRSAEIPPAPKAIDLAADTADRSLRNFSRQTGIEVVFATGTATGVRTNAVKGNYVPLEAARLLLAGTELSVTQDKLSGALMVQRSNEAAPPPKDEAARVEVPSGGRAARTPAPVTPPTDAVQLSPFEVNTSRDLGYVASSTLAGTRFNTQLKDTPAALSIFTADFLDDIGVTNVKDAYEYGLNSATTDNEFTGNGQQGSDITLKIRGLNNASLGRNYFVWANNSDTYNTERLTFARGPNSVIFGIGGAGGIINTDTKRALFARRHELKLRVGSWNDTRVTLDLNEKLHDTLAVRVNLLWQDKDGWRDYEFEQRRAASLATTWRPWSKTQVRLDVETMKVDQNKPLNYSVFDGVTPWIAAGRPLAQSVNQVVPATTTAASTHNNYFIANTGELLRLNGARVSASPTLPAAVSAINAQWVLRDFSMVPRNAWVAGPANNSYSNFDAAGLFIEHEVIKDLFFEAAANIQHRTSVWARPLNWNEVILRADANALRPDGSRNPFAGQYYVDATTIGDQSPNVWNIDYRLTASYRTDLGRRFGRHQIAALLSRREDENYAISRAVLNVGNPAMPANAVAANNRIIYRTYLSFSGANPLNLPDHIGNTLAADVNTGGVRTGYLRTGANNNLTRVDTRLVTTQSSWWNGRLVATLGLRYDEQSAYGSTPVLSPDRVVLGATRISTPNTNDGKTRTFGAVFHLNAALGVYYNNADNFTPQSGTSWDVDYQAKNRPLGNRRGEGQDMGIKFNLWAGRINGSIGYYEANEVNSSKTPLARFTDNAAAIYTALRLPFVELGGSDTTDFTSHGTEIDLTSNLTPAWRMQFNAQRSMSAETDLWPRQTQFLATNLATFRAQATVPIVGNASGNSVGQLTDFIQSLLEEARAVAGKGQLGHIRWSANLFSNYTLTAGHLRGLSVGAGVRWRGPQVAGLTAANDLVWRGKNTVIDASLGYSRKLFGWRSPVRFQLNVSNLLDNDILIPSNSDGVIDYRWSYLRPRSYSLSTTVKF